MSQHIDAMPSISNDALSTSKFVALINSGDLDDYLTAGNYVIARGSDAANVAHMPESTAGKLVVMYGTDAAYYRRQLFLTYSGNKLYMRTYIPGTGWGNWDGVALNSKITDLPNTLHSSYNVLVDAVQISQTETVYTLYGSRKFSDYITLYITPMVEGYFRPGCVIPRSTFAGNGNGTSFTYPSGGIDVEVVVKYLSDTQVKMKYNASAVRDVRIYLGALKLEY